MVVPLKSAPMNKQISALDAIEIKEVYTYISSLGTFAHSWLRS